MSETHFEGKVAQKVLLIKSGKVLVTRDSDDEVFELPGGRLDAGEEPRNGVKREIAEELGVSVNIDGIFDVRTMYHYRDKKDMLVIYYLMSMQDESENFKVDPKEVAEMQWVDATTYKNFEYIPPFKAVLDSYFDKVSL